MYRKSIGSAPAEQMELDFRLCDVAGTWESYEGGPRIRIYRNGGRKSSGYYLEFAYDEYTRFYLPIKKYWNGIRYFDLYGFVGMAYDAARDVLRLSFYGDYYRAEENPHLKCNNKAN